MTEIKFSTEYELFDTNPKIEAGAGASESASADELPRVWMNSAKEGQVIEVEGELCVLTREGIESSLGSWKKGKIFDDHKTLKPELTIYDERFESPFLSFLLDEKTAKSVQDGGGGSIDAIATKIENRKILKMSGVGYSILNKNLTPSCTKEAGCGIPIAASAKLADVDAKWDFKESDYSLEQLGNACLWVNKTVPEAERTKGDYKLPIKTPDGVIVWHALNAAMAVLNGARGGVNINTKDRNIVYNKIIGAYKLFGKKAPKLKAEVKANLETVNKGGIKNMAEGKPEEVTYSKEQVAEIKAAAVGELADKLGNEHKVAMSALETAQSEKVVELEKAHLAALETQRTEVMKQTAMIESLATKYGLSDEAKTALTGAKTLEDALTLFSTLQVEKAEPVVAAKGAESGKSGSGIVMGAAVEAAAPETRKVEEVGTWDPYARKFVATYREEVI